MRLHEVGVGALERLPDEAPDALLMHAVVTRNQQQVGLSRLRTAENERLHDSSDLDAEGLRSHLGRGGEVIEDDDPARETVRGESVGDASFRRGEFGSGVQGVCLQLAANGLRSPRRSRMAKRVTNTTATNASPAARPSQMPVPRHSSMKPRT